MTAGESALQRAEELDDAAENFRRLAAAARREAADYRRAAVSERDLAAVLAPLRDRGWTVLEDRRWPGSRRANVDFVLIGPPGVFVLDAKDWAEVRIENGVLYRGQAAEDAQVDKLHALLDSLHDAVASTGITPSVLTAALVFTGRSLAVPLGGAWALGERDVVAWLLREPRRLAPERVAEIAEIVADACPPILGTAPARVVDASVTAPDGILPGLDDLTTALIEAEVRGSIEDWMVFLHPDQTRLIRTHCNGPARLRGTAGSGKTTVALHRAVHLALRSTEPVLFVTFVRTLPAVMSNLAARISARAADRIEFSGLHAKARDVLDLVGDRSRLDRASVENAFSHAWLTCGVRDELLRVVPRHQYWREEIDSVVKGRGITDRAAYAALKRVGRATRLTAADRDRVWTLYETYQAELERRGTIDYNDLLIRAERAVREHPGLVSYAAVIVDEVQDLTLVGVRLLDALSGDGPNRLLLVGDGAQSVYPGGFALAEAGISIVGRASVLDRNYRNTAQIVHAAQAAIAGTAFDDIEGESLTPDELRADREGPEPVRARASTESALQAALAGHIRELHGRHRVALADMAVLTRTRGDAARLQALLPNYGVATVALDRYEGVPVAGVKVGTIKRAKGLEFAAVMLPDATFAPTRSEGESDEAFGERCALAARELFVGMTRAREHLWLGEVARD